MCNIQQVMVTPVARELQNLEAAWKVVIEIEIIDSILDISSDRWSSDLADQQPLRLSMLLYVALFDLGYEVLLIFNKIDRVFWIDLEGESIDFSVLPWPTISVYAFVCRRKNSFTLHICCLRELHTRTILIPSWCFNLVLQFCLAWITCCSTHIRRYLKNSSQWRWSARHFEVWCSWLRSMGTVLSVLHTVLAKWTAFIRGNGILDPQVGMDHREEGMGHREEGVDGPQEVRRHVSRSARKTRLQHLVTKVLDIEWCDVGRIGVVHVEW